MRYKNIVEKTNKNKTARAQCAMVASARYEASDIGASILKIGGNAIDAAVAVAFALSVCEPNANGLGGGGFMTVYLKEEGRYTFIDFRERAPEYATPAMWKIVDGEVVGNEKSEGAKSVCVPGDVAGLLYAHQKYGVLNIEQLIDPAIDLADNGFEVTAAFKGHLKTHYEKLMRYKEDGNPYVEECHIGDSFKSPALANTLRKVKEQGVDGYYKGDIAKRIVRSINKHGGVVQLSDFEKYAIGESQPIIGEYKGYTIVSSPLPSSGGTHIIQMLNVLEHLNISRYEVNSASYIHILSEVFKLCFLDREAFMGDPAYVDVPIEGLTHKNYALTLAKKIDMHNSQVFTHGNPHDFEPSDTTHFSIVDAHGNMVSSTRTISSFFGSGVVPEHTGVVLNCQNTGFSLDQEGANAVGPFKKPLSSMSPTIITKDGKPFAVLGSPGGKRIITTVVQIIIKLIDYKMSIEEAIDSPRVYDDVDNKILLESRVTDEVIATLKNMGHEIEEYSAYDKKFGGVQAVVYLEDGSLDGAADPRRDGAVIGLNE